MTFEKPNLRIIASFRFFGSVANPSPPQVQTLLPPIRFPKDISMGDDWSNNPCEFQKENDKNDDHSS